MILVDKDINDLVQSKNLISNFNDEQLNSVSYDVIIDKFVVDNKEIDDEEYCVSVGEFIYVKAYENLNMPNNLCCKVVEKNSLMRDGLKVDGHFINQGIKLVFFLE